MSSPRVTGRSANGHAHANGNGRSASASYTVSKEMKYEAVKQEVVEDSASQTSFHPDNDAVRRRTRYANHLCTSSVPESMTVHRWVRAKHTRPCPEKAYGTDQPASSSCRPIVQAHEGRATEEGCAQGTTIIGCSGAGGSR